MGRPQPASVYGRWQTAQLLRIGKSQAEMHRETGIAEAIISKWKLGREVPSERWRQTLATYFGVAPDTVPVGNDANPAGVAQKIEGVTSDRAAAEVVSYPVNPVEHDLGLSQEGAPVIDTATLVYNMVRRMTEDEQARAYRAVMAVGGAPNNETLSHPPARGALSRRKKK